MISDTPKPSYSAVIFTSLRRSGDNGYDDTANRMVELAEQHDGFLGIESARKDVDTTVSYWRDIESIKAWKNNSEHRVVQKKAMKIGT